MDSKRILYIIRRVLFLALGLALFTVIMYACDKTLYFIAGRMTNEVSEDVLRVIHILLSILAYHSFLYAVTMFDNELKHTYFTSENGKFRFIFTAPEPRLSLVLTAVFVAAFPKAFSIKALNGWTEIGVLPSALIMAVVFSILLFVTWIEIVFTWDKTRKKDSKSGIAQMIKHIISACLAYPILAYLLPIFFPTFRTFPAIVKVLFIGLLPFIIALFVVSFSFPVLRAFFIRFNFIRKLKKAAKIHGYKISEIKHPYVSLFTDHDESSFTANANGKTYTCKLLSGMIYSNPMYFGENGKGTIVNSLRLRVFLFGGRLGHIGWHNTDEFARFETHFTYNFEGEGKKVLIVCPTPHTIYATGYGENKRLDVADVIWGYTLMTGTAFINALERDCI